MELSSCYVCKTKKEVSEFYMDSTRKSGIASKCKICSNIINKERRKLKLKNNPEFRKLNNKKIEKKRVVRENGDPVFKLKRRIRHTLRGSFKRKGYSKNTQSQKILGENWNVVKEYFESLFTEGMNWDNMGKWHIDHIIPLSTANSEEDIINLCNYKNLQPLWEKDNLEKSDKIL
jgi:hypothetical protein